MLEQLVIKTAETLAKAEMLAVALVEIADQEVNLIVGDLLC